MKKVSKRILIIPEGWCEYNYAQALKASLEKSKQRGVTVEMPKPNNENKALLDNSVRFVPPISV